MNREVICFDAVAPARERGLKFLADKKNKKVCSEQCRNAAVRYAYAKYKYKIGRLKIEPNFDDYKKGGRLYGENK